MTLLLKAMLLSFARAFVGTLLILLPGVLKAPSFPLAKAAAIAALIAAVTAGLRAAQALLTNAEPADSQITS